MAHAGGAEWVSAVQRAAAAATPLVALAPRTLRLLQLEQAAHATRACTLFVPVDDVPDDDDGDGGAESADDADAHRKCRAALLEASAGRYVLREGRRVDAAAARAHFATAGGDGTAPPLCLGASVHLGLPLAITGVDAATDRLILNGAARLLTDAPILTAAGHVYCIDRLLPLE